MTTKQKVGYKVIKASRRMFAGTSVQEWDVTAYMYKKLAKNMHRGQEATSLFRGTNLVLPLKDATIVPSILGGYFEEVELSIFENMLSDVRHFFDVGANIGVYTVIAGVKGVPEGIKIHAFEPVPENARYFMRNITLNALSNISLVQKAVGDKPGRLKLLLAPDSIATHSPSIKHTKGDINDSVEVDLITIDKYNKKKKIPVDLLKIDVEGYDEKVIRGAQETISLYKPTVFIEFDPDVINQCDGDPEFLIDSLVKVYGRNVFIIDEIKKRVARAHPELLKKMIVYGNTNLIFTNRKKHLQAITSSPYYN
jgi:FkbM family methyltransferase